MAGVQERATGARLSRLSISGARVERDITQNMMDALYLEGVYNPLESELATLNLLRQREKWAEEGATVVFTSGVFDLLHPNHRAYLLHTKLEAVPVHFNTETGHPGAWDRLSRNAQAIYCQNILAQGKIRLIVSVDGDAAVGSRKGHKEEKGSTQRPIYSWQSRARDVLAATTAAQRGDEKLRVPIVDAVTIHDNISEQLADTPHDDIVAIARHIQPDVWSVYYESEDIIERLKGPEGADFASTHTVILPGHEFYTDELLGGRFSTTAIARRLGGVATQH